MLDVLNIVKGAVSTKDLVPALTHIHIYDGRIQGSDGKMYIDAPCEELAGVEATVPCVKFITAVQAAQGTPELTLKDKVLTVKAGKMRVRLPTLEQQSFPKGDSNKGKATKVKGGDFLRRLEQVHEFIGTDASRVWSCGVLVKDGTIYATNNVVIAAAPVLFPGTFNLPSFAVEELLRIAREPVGVWQDKTSITFDLGDDVWLRSQLYEPAWPETAVKLVASVKKAPRVPDGLMKAVQSVVPFCPNTEFPIVHLHNGTVSTAEGAMSAAVDDVGFKCAAWFHAEPLLAVLAKAIHFDPAQYPKPCPFLGANDLRGLIAGISAP